MDVGRSPNTDFRSFYLSTSRTVVSARALLAQDALCALAADDMVWSVALADWTARRPSRWRVAARRRWIAEGRGIFTERDRLRERAADLGLRG